MNFGQTETQKEDHCVFNSMITYIWTVLNPAIKGEQNWCLFYISWGLRVKSISYARIFRRLRKRPWDLVSTSQALLSKPPFYLIVGAEVQ